MVGLVDRIQQIGHPAGAGVVAEVETTFRSARSVIRSLDGGAYRHSWNINTFCGDGSTFVWFGSGSQEVAFAAVQWMSPSNLFVLKKALLNVGNTGLPAGLVTFKMYQVSGFTQQLPINASGITPFATTKIVGHGNKLRSTFPDSDQSVQPATAQTGSGAAGFGPGGTFWGWNNLTTAYATSSSALDVQLANATLFTQDAVPMAALISSSVGVGSTVRDRLGQQALYDADAGFPPCALEMTQGVVFKILAPLNTTTVIAFGLTLEWDEVPAYQLGNN
jgi:hypothetical protein